MKKLTVEDIEVPDFMLRAASKNWLQSDHEQWHGPRMKKALAAALYALAEEPIVPTDEQAGELWDRKGSWVISDTEHYAKGIAREWQRRMFLKPQPELPEEVKLLMFDPKIVKCGVELAGRNWNESILKAYALGQRNKEDGGGR